MLELIADQRKLLGLAVVLRLETKFLIQSIKSDLKNPDETIRSQFLERILQFLKEAIGFDGVHSYLVSGGFCQKSAADDTPTSTCLPAHPQALTATPTSGAVTTSIRFTSDGKFVNPFRPALLFMSAKLKQRKKTLGQGSEHQLEVPDVDSNTSPSCPLVHVTSSRPRAAALAALARASGLSQPSTNSELPFPFLLIFVNIIPIFLIKNNRASWSLAFGHTTRGYFANGLSKNLWRPSRAVNMFPQ